MVGSREILNLPLNQRNPFSLVLLTAGVTGSTSEYFAGMQFNVNGGRKGSTDILINGVSFTPPSDGVNELTVFPSVDAVEEFKVQTSNFSAEFGASGGGIRQYRHEVGNGKPSWHRVRLSAQLLSGREQLFCKPEPCTTSRIQAESIRRHGGRSSHLAEAL